MTAIIVAALLNSEASISDLHCAQGEARVRNSRGSISSRSLGHGARCVLITSIAVKNVDVTLLVCLSEWRNDNLRAKPTHTLVTLTANWIGCLGHAAHRCLLQARVDRSLSHRPMRALPSVGDNGTLRLKCVSFKRVEFQIESRV